MKFKLDNLDNTIMLHSEWMNLLIYGASVICVFVQFRLNYYNVIPITLLTSLMLIKASNIKNASKLLDKKQKEMSIEQFEYLLDKLPANIDNYERVIKLAYYNSRLDWLDIILNKYKSECKEAIDYRLELTLQFILWGGVDAYHILKKNNLFKENTGYLNKKVIKKMFLMYAYDEKYSDLLNIFKDLTKTDEEIVKNLKKTGFNKDLMVILNRLDLDLSLGEKKEEVKKVVKV